MHAPDTAKNESKNIKATLRERAELLRRLAAILPTYAGCYLKDSACRVS